MLLGLVTRLLGLFALIALMLAAPSARAQSWTTIPISFYPGTMILMTDGTVLVHYANEVGSELYPSGIWERLTPDAFGDYSDGTWSVLPTMPSGYAPEYHATAVLNDGRLLVEGGEYDASGAKTQTGLGAIYDPFSNTWTSVSPPPGISQPPYYTPYYGGGQNGAVIGDAASVVLSDGEFMMGDCCGDFFAFFNSLNLGWNSYYDEGKLAVDNSNSEEGWVLLPSGQVLTVNLWGPDGQGSGTTSMLYNYGSNTWTSTGNLPASVEDTTCKETGPMILRRDGTVTAIGGTGQLATYNTSTGTWSAGPLIGGDLGVDDGPGVLLPDGSVFFETSPWSGGNPSLCDNPGNGTVFFEWDGATLTEEPAPADDSGDHSSVEGRMLVLPTGKVLFDDAAYGNNTSRQKKSLHIHTGWNLSACLATANHFRRFNSLHGYGEQQHFGDPIQRAVAGVNVWRR